MKRAFFVVCALWLITSAIAEESPLFSGSSQHYSVASDRSEERSREIAQRMEAALGLFNEYFRFDPARLSGPFKVKIFTTKGAFDLHLQGLIGETRPDFVFLSYRDSSRNVLIGYEMTGPGFDSSLLHYGLIQYLLTFVPETPVWLSQGMAAYLDNSLYDSARQVFSFRANLQWLDSLKDILKEGEGRKKILIEDLIGFDREAALKQFDLFYPEAWGLIHFLLNTPDRRYNRILWDAISLLDGAAVAAENAKRIREKAFGWVKPEELQQAFEAFIFSQKSFNELVQEGIEQYGRKETEKAEASLKKALELRSDDCVPYYYLGLLQYERKNFLEANRYYLQAQERGIDPAVINYALGVNAFAEEKFDQAEKHLKLAKDQNPGAYGEKVDTLIKRIPHSR